MKIFDDLQKSAMKKSIFAGALAASGVVLSVVSIPMGPTKCFPFQHSINVVAGVILGPWWAVGAAFITSLIRNFFGTGSLFAFPGSMFGAFFVGAAACALPDRLKIFAACAEPIGTGIVGAWASAFFLAPRYGSGAGFAFFSASFLTSSVPGAIIGAFVLHCLEKTARRKNAQSGRE